MISKQRIIAMFKIKGLGPYAICMAFACFDVFQNGLGILDLVSFVGFSLIFIANAYQLNDQKTGQGNGNP
jgi:hypothetical protein